MNRQNQMAKQANRNSKTARNRRKRQKKALARGVQSKEGFQFLNGNSVNIQPFGRTTTKVSAPVSQALKGLSGKALIKALPNGGTRVRHTEYLMDVNATVAFSVEAYAVNPGNPEIFPWLYTLARRYESYKFRSLNFRYETQAPTSTSGTMILTVDYNADASLPRGKTQMLAMESAVRAPLWSPINHRSLSHNLNKRATYFVRNGDQIQSADLYDTGQLMLGSQGAPFNADMGELYVDYEVDLLTPTLPSQPVEPVAKYVSGGTVTGNQILGSSPVGSGGDINMFPIEYIGGVQFVQFLSQGQYMFTVDLFGSGFVETTTGNWNVSTVLSLNYINVTNVPSGSFALVDGSGQFATICLICDASPGSGISIQNVNSSTTILSSSIRISVYNYSLQ